MARVTNQSDAGLSGKLNDKVYVKHAEHLLNQQRFREINRFYKQFKNTPNPGLPFTALSPVTMHPLGPAISNRGLPFGQALQPVKRMEGKVVGFLSS